MIKKLNLIMLISLGCNLVATDRSRRYARVRTQSAPPALRIPVSSLSYEENEISCCDLLRATAATCLFPCLLLFSNIIIKNMPVNDKNK